MSKRTPLTTASKIIDLLSFLWDIASLTGLPELIFPPLILRAISFIFIINDIIKGLRARKQNPDTHDHDDTTSVSCPKEYFDYSFTSCTLRVRIPASDALTQEVIPARFLGVDI